MLKALTYNQLLKYFKAPYKYEPMKDGDKIKWVYLKNNPLGLDSVGLTGYNDPKQILDLVKQYIDYDLIWQKELENKLDDFYSAMGWEKPNPNLAKASQFFDFNLDNSKSFCIFVTNNKLINSIL